MKITDSNYRSLLEFGADMASQTTFTPYNYKFTNTHVRIRNIYVPFRIVKKCELGFKSGPLIIDQFNNQWKITVQR